MITTHFPRKLLSPFDRAGFVDTIQPEQIVELKLPEIKTVRFLLTRNAGNPILSLFSDRKDEVASAFTQLKNQTGLLRSISDYIFEIINHYEKEILKMYTREDFLREHPRDKRPLFFFPWDKETHLMELEKARRESLRTGKLEGELELLKKIQEEGLLSKEQFTKRATPLRKKLKKFYSDM